MGYIPKAPPGPPSVIVGDVNYRSIQRENEARYKRWNLKMQCFMLIEADRRFGLNTRKNP